MEETLLNQMVDIIGNTGFPIVVSVYLLNRMEKKLDIMISLLQQLTTTIKQ
ncbi:YvrJ protein family protein [Granulicatella balaenopterae]|uniref:YvrJ protein family protein n=1 Tax=Granulicatella balaenopterae TaxID=137733 RepID=A0A1H9JSI4_9LACT|nr:YvrJ family protein [Granulicatella balaenopterae]SEQ89787.1 YvrJ protein family protein [Granulicatella balaenopterae]